MDIASDLPIGRSADCAPGASPRGTFGPRARSPPEPAQGAPPGRPDVRDHAELVAFKRAVVRELASSRPASCSIPDRTAQSVVDSSLPASSGLLVATGDRMTARPPPDQPRPRRLSVAKAKRMGATAAKLLVYYHPMRPMPPTRSDSSGRRRRLPGRRPRLFVEPLSFSIDPAVPRLRARLGGSRRDRPATHPLGEDILKAESRTTRHDRPGRLARRLCRAQSASRVPGCSCPAASTMRPSRPGRVACEAGASGVLVGRSVWARQRR
jgi:hypothetical protein